MTIEVGLDQQAFPTGAGNVSFTSTENTQAPVGVMAFLGDGAINGTADAAIRLTNGFTDGTTDCGIASLSNFFTASGSVLRRQLDTELLLRGPSEGAGTDKLAHNAFLSNGWQGVSSLNSADAKLVLAAMFGGTDVTVETGIMAATSAVNVEQTITLTNSSLNPNVIIWNTIGTTAAAGSGTSIPMGWGISYNNGSSIDQFCFNGRLNIEGAASANPISTLHSDRVLGSMNTTTSIDWELECTDMSAGSIGVTPRVNNLSGDEINYIAIQFDNANISLDEVTLPTTASTYTDTVGFQPKFILQCLTMHDTMDSIENDDKAGVIAFSIFNSAGEEFCYSWAEEDASASMDNQSMCHDRPVYYAFDDGTVGSGAGAGNGFDTGTNNPNFTSTGYSIDFDTVNSTARKGFRLAIGEAAAMQASTMAGWMGRMKSIFRLKHHMLK